MADSSREISPLIERATSGDQQAMVELFEQHRARLKTMVRMRLNRKLQGRVDDSDVLQDAYLEAAKRLSDYLDSPRAPFFLWLRQIVRQKLVDVHRFHLGAEARDAGIEVSLHRGPVPMASSISLAAQLLGRLTSPTQAAVKAEMRIALQDAIGGMDDLDREIISLRHFEHLSNQEAAEELEIEAAAASKRYRRALQRLQVILNELGLVDK